MLAILFLGELMDDTIEKLVELDITYMRERKGLLDLLKKKYPGNMEIVSTVDNLIGVREGCNEILKDYTRFDISHLCSLETVKLAPPEGAKTALAILKGSTQ